MKRKWQAFLCMAALLLAVLPVSASADSGPKPQITIQVQNAPSGTCYIDLQTFGSPKENWLDNLEWNDIDRSALDKDMITALEDVCPSDRHYVMLHGADAPVFFNQTSDNSATFSYFGVPNIFWIAVYSAETGRVLVSETQFRDQLQQLYTIDYRTGEVQAGSTMLSYLKQFASSLLPTLLIEGLLLLPFGFWDRRNAKVFLGVNIGTQLLLTVVTAACMWIGMPFYRYLVFAPLEIVIWIVEAVIYRKRLYTRRETAHPVVYALCANALSAAATLFSVRMVFPWI